VYFIFVVEAIANSLKLVIPRGDARKPRLLFFYTGTMARVLNKSCGRPKVEGMRLEAADIYRIGAHELIAPLGGSKLSIKNAA